MVISFPSFGQSGPNPPTVITAPSEQDVSCDENIRSSLSSWLIMRAGFLVNNATQLRSIFPNADLLNELDSLLVNVCSPNELVITQGFFAVNETSSTDTFLVDFRFTDDSGIPIDTIPPADLRVPCSDSSKAEMIAWIRNGGNGQIVDACRGVMPWTSYSWTSNGRSGSGINSEDASFDNIIENSVCDQVINFTFFANNGCDPQANQSATFELFLDSSLIIVDTFPKDLIIDCSEEIGQSITRWYLDNAGMRTSSLISSTTISASRPLDSILDESTLLRMSGCHDFDIDLAFFAIDTFGTTTASFPVSIQVVDDVRPTITNQATDLIFTCRDDDIPVALENWIRTFGGAAATDNCSDSVLWQRFNWIGDGRTGEGDFTNVPFNNIINSNTCGQSYLFFFDVEDVCGNVTEVLANFEILDTAIVVIAPATDFSLPCEFISDASLPGWYNVGGGLRTESAGVELTTLATKSLQEVQAEFNTSIMDGCNEGMVNVGFYSLDSRGVSSDTFNVSFSSIDEAGPVIQNTPSDISFECAEVDSNAVRQWLISQGGAIATDVCSDSTFWTEFLWMSNTGNSGGGNFVDGPFTILDGADCFEFATVTFVVSDPCGNTSTTSALFSIQDTTPLMDNTAPIITQNPQDLNVNCSIDILDSLSSWYGISGGLMATDENGVIKLRATRSFALVQQAFNASNPQSNCASGTVTVGFFALDTLDNSTDTVFATFSAVDSIPPTITIEAQDQTIACDVGRQDSLTNWIKRFGGAVAIDDCSMDDIIWAQFGYRDSEGRTGSGSFLNGPFNFIGTDLCEWSADVDFFVTDACGNVTSTSATFRIEDNQAPVFPFILPDTTLNCDNVPSATAIIANDFCEGQIMVTAVDSSTQSSDETVCEFFNYTIFRTYLASDGCGNMNSFTQIITISDTLEPRYEAPGDITISCLDDSNPDITGRPINVKDNCASEVVITFSDTPLGEGCERQIIRTWDIRDLCGSSLILPQTITIKDTLAPSFTSPASDITLSCTNAQDVDQSFAIWVADLGGAEASDECGSRITTFAAVPGTYDLNDPSTFPGEAPGMLDFVTCPSIESGSFRLEIVDFVFVDECNNASVSTASFKIVDNIPPALSGGLTDTVLTILDRSECSIDLLIPALSVSDACGNLENSFSMTFRQDISSPELGNEQVPVDSFTARFGPISTDDFETNESVTLTVQMINIDADDPTEYFNIVAEDGTDLGRTPLTDTQCGDKEFTLTLSPSQINSWAADGFIDINFFPNIPQGLSGALAINDICFGAGTRMILNLNIALSVQGFVDYQVQIDDNQPITLPTVEDYTATIDAGNHTVTYLVTDCAGNVNSSSFNVTVIEDVPPVVVCSTDQSAILTTNNCTTDYVLPAVSSVTDNCNLADTFSVSVSGATTISSVPFNPNTETKINLNNGINILEYTVFDGSGNTAACNFNVNVQDLEAPVILCRDTALAQAHPSGLLPLLVDPAVVVSSVTDNCELGDYQFSNTEFNCSDIDSIVAVNVVVSDLSGNTSQCISNVRIIPYVLEPIAQSLVCTGDTLKLIANVPAIDSQSVYTFNWSGPNGFNSSLENPVIPNSTPNLSGTYNLVVLGANSCRSIGSVDVAIEDFNMPLISVDIDTICAGDSIILSATDYQSTVTYKWFAGNAPAGIPIGETTSPNFSHPPTEGQETFYVIAENEACETTPSEQVNITINVIPTLDPTPIIIQICERSSFRLQANYIGTDITTYRWTGPNGFESNEANPPAFNNVSTDLSGEYILTVIENGCPSPPKVTKVDIQSFPITPAVNVDSIVCEGASLILSLTDTSAGNGTLNWLLNGELYESVDGNGLVIPDANDSLEGLWQVYVQNGACLSDTSDGVLVTIENMSPINILNDTLQCSGDQVQLMANVLPNATYAWSGPNGFNSILEQPIATIESGVYSVTVTTSSGCSNVATLNVTGSPLPTIMSLSATEISECVDGTNTIIITASVGPDSNYTYEWEGPNDFISDNDTLFITNATASQSGIYSLIVQNEICESIEQSVTISLTDIPPIPIVGENRNACVGEALTLTVQNHQETTERYVWTTPMGMFETDVPSFSIPEVGIANAGIYLVRADDEGCISSDSELLTVNVFGIPNAPGVSSNGPVCEGDDLVLQATQILDAEYIWSGPNGFTASGDRVVIRNTAPANEGDYSVQIVLNDCPSLPSTLTDIEFFPRPDKPVTEVTILDVCRDDMNGESMLCINSPQYNPDGDYQWFNLTTDEVLGRTSERCLVLSADSPIILGENRIMVEELNEVCNSEPSDIISFVLYESLNAIADAGPDIVACDITNVALDASNPNQGTGRWKALDPDINFSDPTDPKSLVFDINEGENVLIWQLENGACLGDTDTIIVSTEFSIVANNDEVQTAYNTPITITPELNDDLTEEYNVEIVSQPSSGSILNNADGFEFIPENGFLGPVEVVYEICSVSCQENCDRASIVINVGDVTDCFAPSLITPNGDGINDAFVIPCIESGLYPNNQLYIYNQYGDQVLDAPSYNNDWQGQYNGNDLPTGTYYYVFRANNQLAPEKGFIIIER